MITTERLGERAVFHVQRETNPGVWTLLARNASSFEQAKEWAARFNGPLRIVMERTTAFVCEDGRPVERHDIYRDGLDTVVGRMIRDER